jgi:hypothetical protein
MLFLIRLLGFFCVIAPFKVAAQSVALGSSINSDSLLLGYYTQSFSSTIDRPSFLYVYVQRREIYVPEIINDVKIIKLDRNELNRLVKKGSYILVLELFPIRLENGILYASLAEFTAAKNKRDLMLCNQAGISMHFRYNCNSNKYEVDKITGGLVGQAVDPEF